MRNLLHHIVMFPRNLIIGMVTMYQQTLSPDHGPLRHLYTYGYCRHSPTCSEYAKIVVKKHGAIIGSLLAVKRVITCNPFAKPSEKRLLEVAAKL